MGSIHKQLFYDACRQVGAHYTIELRAILQAHGASGAQAE
jgi:hypothetical protein